MSKYHQDSSKNTNRFYRKFGFDVGKPVTNYMTIHSTKKHFDSHLKHVWKDRQQPRSPF